MNKKIKLSITAAVVLMATNAAARELVIPPAQNGLIDITDNLQACIVAIKSQQINSSACTIDPSDIVTGDPEATNTKHKADKSIHIPSGEFVLKETITIDTDKIVLRGNGKADTGLTEIKIHPLGNQKKMFNISEQNITIRNIRLNAQDRLDENTKDADGKRRSAAVIINPINFGVEGDGVKGLSIINVSFNFANEHGIALGASGTIPLSGLTVLNSDFYKGNIGINILNRKWHNDGPHQNPVYSVDKIVVDNNRFIGQHHASITIDCANDSGSDQESRNIQLTNFNNSIFTRNSINNALEGGEFGIAVSQAKNVRIHNNKKIIAQTDAVHLEFRNKNIKVTDNKEIRVTATTGRRQGVRFGVGDSRTYYIKNAKDVKNERGYVDNTKATKRTTVNDLAKNRPDDFHHNGHKTILVSGNVFKGQFSQVIEGVEAEDVTIKNNDFSNATVDAGQPKVLLSQGGKKHKRIPTAEYTPADGYSTLSPLPIPASMHDQIVWQGCVNCEVTNESAADNPNIGLKQNEITIQTGE